MGKMEQMEQMPLLEVTVRMAVQEVQEEGEVMEEMGERRGMCAFMVPTLIQSSTKLEERVDFLAKADEEDLEVKEAKLVREELEVQKVKEELLVLGQVKKDTSTANTTMMSHVIVGLGWLVVEKTPPGTTWRSSLPRIMVIFLAAMDTRAPMGLQERMDSRVCLDCRESRVPMVKMDKMA